MFAQLHIFLSQAAVIWHLYLPARSTSTDSSTVCPVQTCARTTKCIDDCQGKHEKRCKCTCVLRNTHISTRCTMIPHGFVATSSCSCTYRCTRTQAHTHIHTHTHTHQKNTILARRTIRHQEGDTDSKLRHRHYQSDINHICVYSAMAAQIIASIQKKNYFAVTCI